MVYLALSCLQGRPAKEAVEELLELEPDGIQLTPGNYLTPEFREWFLSLRVPYTLHHGFDWVHRRRKVWHNGQCVALPEATVHPPKNRLWPQGLNALLEYAITERRTLETMYPPYYLGRGWELETALEAGAFLAVDVSHLEVQQEKQVISDRVLREVLEYTGIKEIHVSQQRDGKDVHRPITEQSYGLQWAKEYPAPVVLECYMHRLTRDERMRQLEILRA